jgi:uncharacterized protein
MVKLRVIAALLVLAFPATRALGGDEGPSERLIAAIDAYNRGDFAAAFFALKAEADRGDSDAEVNLGYLYARGQGVSADQLEAFHLYELSAEQGNGEGMNALGYKYQFGTGIAPDMHKAVNWYCLAVLHGNPRAMNNLALLLAQGKSIPRDIGEARSLWRQAAGRGHVNAMWNLGTSLAAGPGTPLDPEEGNRWILLAARNGQPAAEQYVRRAGYHDPLPPPRDEAATMTLQPRDAPPGKAAICGSLVS